MLQDAYNILYIAVLIVLGIASLIAMIRSITGKTIINRFIGINMLTTLVAIVICVLTLFLDESYLPDIAVVYAMLSCIAVMLLNKLYINLFRKSNKGKEGDKDA